MVYFEDLVAEEQAVEAGGWICLASWLVLICQTLLLLYISVLLDLVNEHFQNHLILCQVIRDSNS